MIKSKEVLKNIVEALVEKTNEVQITETTDERGVLFTLDIASNDMGKVIGRSGETAKAIRTILRATGMTENSHISLKINEPQRKPEQSDKEMLGE